MTPFFSVVIPTFNNEATLPATLASVLAQSFRDFEVIIANDGGQDPSEFLQADDPRVRIVNLPGNGGVAAARNAGFAEAAGRYVYFLDSDDLIAPDLLAAMVRIIGRQDAKIIVFGHLTVDEGAVEAGKAALLAAPRTLRCEVLGPVEFFCMVRDHSGRFIPSGAVFLRAAVLEVLGEQPWFTELRNNQDTFLFLQLGAIHPVVLCQDRFFLYLVRSGSLSSNRVASWSARRRAMELIRDWLAERDCDPRLALIARDMRHTAARRVARLQRAAGRRAEARAALIDDLRYRFNWKSAVLLLRNALPF